MLDTLKKINETWGGDFEVEFIEKPNIILNPYHRGGGRGSGKS